MLNINNSENEIEFRKYYLKPGFLFASKDRVIVSTVLENNSIFERTNGCS